MKIGVDARQLSGPIVGTARALASMLKVWSEDPAFNHEVFLYSPGKLELGFPNRFHVRAGSGVGRLIGGTLWLQAGLPAMAAADSLDVFWATTDILSLPLARKIPTLLTVQDIGYYRIPELLSLYVRSMYRLFFRRSLAAATRIMTTTSAVGAELAKLGVAEAKLRAVHLGVEPAAGRKQDTTAVLKKRDIADGFFLFVGHLRPNKNLERMTLGFRLFVSKCRTPSKPSLVIVGGRTKTDAPLFKLLADPETRKCVRYLGYVPDGELAALYSGALAFVSIATYEGFGLPFLEAMSRGLPVIASRLPTTAEVCGDAAVYADPLSLESIADAFGRIWSDERLREELRRKGLDRIKGFTWTRAAGQVLRNLEEIARR